jgi:hypothetical protein
LSKLSKRYIKNSIVVLRTSLRNWNDGMLEFWNVGFGRLGEWGIGVMEKSFFFAESIDR